MAKDKTDYSKLMAKAPVRRPSSRKKPEGMEDAVKSIHDPRGGSIRQSAAQDTKRCSVDLPEDVYRAMKIRTVSLGMTIKDYMYGLVLKDLQEAEGDAGDS